MIMSQVCVTSFDGADLVWEEEGDGQPVVFVHGVTTDRSIWRHQRNEISSLYRFVALDLRHHGASSKGPGAGSYGASRHARDLKAIIQQLGDRKVHLIGFSYGANVALELLREATDLVASVVLVEASLEAALPRCEEAKRALNDRKLAFAPIAELFERGDHLACMRVLSEWTDNGHHASWDHVDSAYVAMLERNASTVGRMLTAEPSRAWSAGDLARIEVPALVMNGAATQALFSLVGEGLVRSLPRARRVVLAGSSHDIANQVPTEFNAELMKFLADF
jgi:pimeloyl-ACP methyl ester carboxylesterase